MTQDDKDFLIEVLNYYELSQEYLDDEHKKEVKFKVNYLRKLFKIYTNEQK